MISQRQALRQLKMFDAEISSLYSKPALDYRGRTVDSKSVSHYLKTEAFRFAEIASLLPYPPQNGARLLDVGIAYGFLSALLKMESDWGCEGLDLSKNIPVYGAFARKHQIPLYAGKLGVSPLPFPGESFQAIIFSEVLEHLRLSPQIVFKELWRLLSAGGYLIVTTPNIARLTNLLKLLVGKNPVEAFPEDIVSENITEHLTHIREYTMSELRNLVRHHGFEIIQARYSCCMERRRPHLWLTACIPAWRGNLMILARKKL